MKSMNHIIVGTHTTLIINKKGILLTEVNSFGLHCYNPSYTKIKEQVDAPTKKYQRPKNVEKMPVIHTENDLGICVQIFSADQMMRGVRTTTFSSGDGKNWTSVRKQYQ